MPGFLLHLIPRFYDDTFPAAVVDLTIPEFNIRLIGDAEIQTVRPYPNKKWLVACRKPGRGQRVRNRVAEGILLDIDRPTAAFNCIVRWDVALNGVVTHRVRYSLSDAECDAASDKIGLWFGMGEFSNRAPNRPKLPSEPRMSLVRDLFEAVTLPTIERERLHADYGGPKMPKTEMAFVF